MKWLMIAFALLSAVPLSAQEMRSVAVTGNASIEVVPDRARISVGVEVVALDPQQAMQDLAQRSRDVVDTIIAAGIEEKNIQTSQLSLQPYWDGKKQNGFVASNGLNVEVAAIDEMPALLGALAKAGMNDLGGLQFFSSQQDAKEREAMLLALEDARARAAALAEAAGMKLGDPISIDYSSGGGMPRQLMMARAASFESADMPVQAGEVSISANVNIRYELVN